MNYQELNNKQQSNIGRSQLDGNLNTEFDVGLLIYIARRNLIWFPILIIVLCILAMFILRYTPFIYKSSAVVQVLSENRAKDILKVQ
jgi:chromate transport protein ChrA